MFFVYLTFISFFFIDQKHANGNKSSTNKIYKSDEPNNVCLREKTKQKNNKNNKNKAASLRKQCLKWSTIIYYVCTQEVTKVCFLHYFVQGKSGKLQPYTIKNATTELHGATCGVPLISHIPHLLGGKTSLHDSFMYEGSIYQIVMST